MKSLNENDKREVFELYDQYAHSRLSRKDFVQKLSMYAVGGITVAALLTYLMPKYAQGVQLKPGDPRVQAEYVTYSSPKGGGEIRGLLCRPANQSAALGGVVVVHENRGLNPYIEDVARRAALAGFVSFAPDALTPLGGYPGNDDEGRAMQSERNRDEMLEDFIAAALYLKGHQGCNGKVGVVGFCFGGWVSNMMAARMPDLSAAVPFYGGQAPVEEVPAIKAPIQLHFAEHDARVNEGWPAYEAALKAHGKDYIMYMYPNTHHGFHNDTTPRFDKDAAELAWSRTAAFFHKHLS